MDKIVHVDAKIIGRDKPENKKRIFIAYKIEGEDEQRIEEINGKDAEQTDGAELYAIRLAMRELDGTGTIHTEFYVITHQ